MVEVVLVERNPRRPLRNRQPTPIPSTDDPTQKASGPAEPKNLLAKGVEHVEKPPSKDDNENPLEGFGDQTFSTIQTALDSSTDHEPHANEIVLSWKAQTAATGQNDDLPSSSLPPSSPLPPFSDDSDDISFDRNRDPPSDGPGSIPDNLSDSSDPFGFFAAEKKLRERRKVLHLEVEKTPPSTIPLQEQTKSPRRSIDASPSPQPALTDPSLIPRRSRSPSSPLSSVPDEEPGTLGERARISQDSARAEGSFGVRPKRTRNAHIRQESSDEDDGIPHRRKAMRKVRGGSSAVTGKGKKVERSKEIQASKKPKGTAIASGRRRRLKKDDEEAEHFEGVDDSSGDEGAIRVRGTTLALLIAADMNIVGQKKKRDRDQFKIDRAKRITEFKALDDYELEVEEVLF